MQLCKADKPSSGVFGGVVENMGDLAAVKQTAADWQAGMCAAGDSLVPSGEVKDEAVLDLVELHNKNGTLSNDGTLFSNTILARKCMAILPRQNKLQARDFCSYIQVLGGDTCTSLASRCGIGGSQFTTYSPKIDCTNPKAQQPNHSLGLQYGLKEEEIEGFNKGKTWAWTQCMDILIDYKMCLSSGNPPLPPPQEGAQCGPLVSGTTQPTDGTSMVDLNPCPLKAYCSNWGFCGPFPEHCDINAPEGGGPGTKLPGFQSTCISNCGNEIKQNSGPPAAFSRVGYYESWNMGRDCLWLRADKANTDGNYTHMHWVGRVQAAGAQAHPVVRRLGLLDRASHVQHHPAETFATNLAQFAQDQGIYGIGIDWEYPGAPDITVDEQPIWQTGDGVAYVRFLTSLKQKLGTDKSIAIAAPASHWYLKAFPIDRISAVIDYIVYMTHVNLTETRNTLSIITKAGVANNKVMVGESSYGRSFHMAVNGCWGPLCDFTGTRIELDESPGRCTATKGYICNAEINELITQGSYSRRFHDGGSTRTCFYDWKRLNFGGSIDWAVDLQMFGDDDMKVPIDRGGDTGDKGCVSGEAKTANSGNLCEFTCSRGLFPEFLCECVTRGEMLPLPPENPVQGDIIACARRSVVDKAKDDGIIEVGWSPENPNYFNYTEARLANANRCLIYQNARQRDEAQFQCCSYCKSALDEAKGEGRTSHYGCIGFFSTKKYPNGIP
ncbi:hypothetical protein CGLO_00144 [Colletotrichum gloeosporioides Cg-14]|uniref:chitinase n=1 Tax=Colletotrichum gloeosporioides (strain Cg-14) TaxID=1237896 RepID=T0L4Q1_COLGC|nr:hypothetical protein CGLO_00144 [Colletotrichum gloeosporioides Cg-14]